jgi:hypothetical protein
MFLHLSTSNAETGSFGAVSNSYPLWPISAWSGANEICTHAYMRQLCSCAMQSGNTGLRDEIGTSAPTVNLFWVGCARGDAAAVDDLNRYGRGAT